MLIRTVPERGRIYIALGSMVGAYSSDTFFTTSLRRPMADLSTFAHVSRGSYPYETFSLPEAFFNAESSGSSWITPSPDAQIVLNDFDGDDRGYVYIASGIFGWGIEFDDGAVDGSHLDFVYQAPRSSLDFTPETIVSFKSGTSYYVAVGVSSYQPRTNIYDVTNPVAPVLTAVVSGMSNAWQTWSRRSGQQRLAVISTDGKLRVYDFAALAAATTGVSVPHVFELSPASGSGFGGIAFDADGALWVVTGPPSVPGTASLVKLTPEDGTYVSTSMEVAGGAMTVRASGSAATMLDIGGGYLAIAGRVSSEFTGRSGLRLFRFVDDVPALVDTADFFEKYYHPSAAQGLAIPSRSILQHMRLVEEASKTYLIYSAYGLGDVFELERGDAVRISTETALDLVPNPSSAGAEVTLTATITPQAIGDADPVGAVTFTIDGFPFTTAPLVLDNGVFRATVVTTTLGKYPVEFAAMYEGDDHYDASTSSAAEHHPDFLMAPEGFDGTLQEGMVRLTWQQIPNVDRYQILRRQGTAFTVVHDATWPKASTLTFDDPVASAGAVHVYRVRGVSDDGTPGFETDPTAVLTSTFTDPVVTAGVAIKALHIYELRDALNAYRAALGLGAEAFDDPAVAAGMPIRAVHVIQLREAFNEVRTELGLGSSTLPFAPSGSVVFAQHIMQLRSNVQ